MRWPSRPKVGEAVRPKFEEPPVLKIWGSLAPKIWGDRPEWSFQRFGSASPTFGERDTFVIGFAFSMILHLAQILETGFPEVGQASPKF